MGKNTEAVQIRYSPLSVDIPVGKNTNIYLNPHYSGQMDFKQDKWTNSAGVFAGVTQKLNENASLSLEAQRYNLQDIKDNSAKNWSVNAIVSYKF
jgi:outer membrane autotransporter barrel domain protein